jgi:hypothetical protein
MISLLVGMFSILLMGHIKNILKNGLFIQTLKLTYISLDNQDLFTKRNRL